MGTTSRLELPYPDDGTSNDVPAHIKALADKIGPIMAVDLQGTFANRPPAGVRGRTHWSTDKKILARDDGTVWRVIYQDWTDYAVGGYAFDGNNTGLNWLGFDFVADSGNSARYSIVGRSCHVSVTQLIEPTVGSGFSWALTLPVPARTQGAVGNALVQNVAGVALIVPNSKLIAGPSPSNALQAVSLRKYNISNITNPSVATYEHFDITYEMA